MKSLQGECEGCVVTGGKKPGRKALIGRSACAHPRTCAWLAGYSISYLDAKQFHKYIYFSFENGKKESPGLCRNRVTNKATELKWVTRECNMNGRASLPRYYEKRHGAVALDTLKT